MLSTTTHKMLLLTACANAFTILASFCDAPLANSGLFYWKKVRDILIWHIGAHSVQSACTIHIFSEFNLSAFYHMKMYLDWRQTSILSWLYYSRQNSY